MAEIDRFARLDSAVAASQKASYTLDRHRDLWRGGREYTRSRLWDYKESFGSLWPTDRWFNEGVGVDLMGTGEALWSMMRDDNAFNVVSVSLELPYLPEDERYSHLYGNLLLGDTWKEVYDEVYRRDPAGASLIVNRGVDGMRTFPPDLTVLKSELRLATDLLKPGGILLLQVPRGLKRHLPQQIKNNSDATMKIGNDLTMRYADYSETEAYAACIRVDRSVPLTP